jgi:hypothetical protein
MLCVQVVLIFMSGLIYEIKKFTIDQYKNFNYLYNKRISTVYSNNSNISLYKLPNS